MAAAFALATTSRLDNVAGNLRMNSDLLTDRFLDVVGFGFWRDFLVAISESFLPSHPGLHHERGRRRNVGMRAHGSPKPDHAPSDQLREDAKRVEGGHPARIQDRFDV
jgi:hypothetical protein